MFERSLLRRGLGLFALTILCVVLFDWLFWGQGAGWTLGAALVGLAGVLWLRNRRVRMSVSGRFWAVFTLGIASSLCLEPTPLALALGAAGLLGLVAARQSGWACGLAGRLAFGFFFLLALVARPIIDLQLARRASRRRSAAPRMRVLPWLAPLALAGIFVALFAVANPVWSHWLANVRHALAHILDWFDHLPSFTRMAFWLAILACVWTLLRFRMRGLLTVPPPGPREQAETPVRDRLAIRSLMLFVGVFAVQLMLDARYLLLGAALPDGMTHAEYAHRGAYPLVATALLAGIFVLVFFRPGGLAQRSNLGRKLVVAWTIENLLLLGFAGMRLVLYVDTYGLTGWRVSAAVWMLLVVLGLGLTLHRVLCGHDNGWLLARIGAMAVLVLGAVSFVPVERTIAAWNVAHCRERQALGWSGVERATLDVAYLEQLGPEVAPILARAAGELQTEGHERQAAAAAAASRRLELQLAADASQWRRWTVRRALARR